MKNSLRLICVLAAAVFLASGNAAFAARGGHMGGHMANARPVGSHGHGHGHGGFRGALFVGGGLWLWSAYDTWPFYDDYLPFEWLAPAYIEQGETPGEQGAAAWYYCASPAGYYPYVQACPSGWQRVQPDLPPGMY